MNVLNYCFCVLVSLLICRLLGCFLLGGFVSLFYLVCLLFVALVCFLWICAFISYLFGYVCVVVFDCLLFKL